MVNGVNINPVTDSGRAKTFSSVVSPVTSSESAPEATVERHSQVNESTIENKVKAI